MQKKLYFLNEEEKNRILNLHESRTKKQYLINEGTEEGDINPSISYKETTQKKTTSGLEKRLWDNRADRVAKLRKKCTDTPFNSSNPIYKELYNWMINKGSSMLGFDWKPLPLILKKIKTLNQYCEVSNSLKKGDEKHYSQYKYSLGDWLWTKIKSEGSWIKYFERPLTEVLREVGLETLESKKPIEMADKKEEAKQKKQWYVLKKKYSDEIKNALNMDSKTLLSDNDIKVIYDKLVQQGMIK